MDRFDQSVRPLANFSLWERRPDLLGQRAQPLAQVSKRTGAEPAERVANRRRDWQAAACDKVVEQAGESRLPGFLE